MRGLLRKLFGSADDSATGKPGNLPVEGESVGGDHGHGALRKGEVINGKYEVIKRLGEGGFGTVYLVLHREIRTLFALKILRPEWVADSAVGEAFRREILLWVQLERHPSVVPARWVDKLNGQLIVLMEYVAGDARGRVTLADHLTVGVEIDEQQVLRWAIQFCSGMEHATARGIRCHRDIKPCNILIDENRALKICDFGLAVAAEWTWQRGWRSTQAHQWAHDVGSSGTFSFLMTEGKGRCGTPGYMAPEVFRGETADPRSDIYSFGLVLWQMLAVKSEPPFMVPWRGSIENLLHDIYHLQMREAVPPVKGAVPPVVARCLRADPGKRYRSFQDVRSDLEGVYERRYGMPLEVVAAVEDSASFWTNKAGALSGLGRYHEAVECCRKAIEKDSRMSHPWNNMGAAFSALGRLADAMQCYDRAIAIDPQFVSAWRNKGGTHLRLEQPAEAIRCFEAALEIDPRVAEAWDGIGSGYVKMHKHEKAVCCFDKALAIDPRNAVAMCNKGTALIALGRPEEALACLGEALEIHTGLGDAWRHRGRAFMSLERFAEAVPCFERVLSLNPNDFDALYCKAVSEDAAGLRDAACSSYENLMKIGRPGEERALENARKRLRILTSKGV